MLAAARHSVSLALQLNLGLNAGYEEDGCLHLIEAGSTGGKVIVHSTNHVAAEYMRKILTDASINVEVAQFDVLGVLRERSSDSSLRMEAAPRKSGL